MRWTGIRFSAHFNLPQWHIPIFAIKFRKMTFLRFFYNCIKPFHISRVTSFAPVDKGRHFTFELVNVWQYVSNLVPSEIRMSLAYSLSIDLDFYFCRFYLSAFNQAMYILIIGTCLFLHLECTFCLLSWYPPLGDCRIICLLLPCSRSHIRL